MLDNPNEPVSDLSYFDCLDVVAEKAMVCPFHILTVCPYHITPFPSLLSVMQVLGEAGSQITAHAKKGEFDEFGVAVDKTSQAVCQLTEAAAQVRLSLYSHLIFVLCVFFIYASFLLESL